MIGAIIKLGIAWQVGINARETIERHNYWKMAREYCDSVGKPILLIGMRKWPWLPPNGDITLDIDQRVENIEGGICADERDIPFGDKVFGTVINEHTLEHLDTPEDVEVAVNECVRVADIAIFIAPSPYNISNLGNPKHPLRLWFDQVNNKIRVEKNPYRLPIGQVMVSEDNAPRIEKIGNGFIIT